MLQRNRDLWLVIGLALASMIAQLPGAPAGMHVVFGFVLAVLCPGYALSAALFPQRSLGWPERAALTLGLSFTLAIFGAVFFNATPGGITNDGTEAVSVGATLAGSLVAIWRRRRAAPGQQPPGLQLRFLDWAQLGLAGLVALCALWVVRVPLATSDVVGYTLLTMTPGKTQNQLTVNILISSGEFSATTYHLAVTDNGAPVQDWPAITLAPGGKWQQTVDLPLFPISGRVQALLYRLTNPSTAYRSVTVVLGQ